MKVWVCQVRRQVFVGGESQRCRHPRFETELLGCGEMELIGGEPVEWCLVHRCELHPLEDNPVRCRLGEWMETYAGGEPPCLFESQIRVGP